MATLTNRKDRCWLCDIGQVIETIEKNVKVPGVPGCGAVTLPEARVGRCDHCHAVLYALRTDKSLSV